ncbi:fluoride efflux transporter FluC [Lentilactobacillus raoultii]|uniref:Fluoride-specific ion channel FluC n=1 Tax=Lentilactobacillus raoultii TaxID=1987503 RepID=A0ABW3PHT7_9LACO|nr:CrcB family protein [Lentilactobacillus raoultii]
MVIIWVALGAGFGAVLRYLITLVGKRYWPQLPFATLVINVIGATLAGFLVGIQVPTADELFLLTGMCGGFTTFSTFTTDTFVLLRNRRWTIAATYYFGTIMLGFLAAYLGLGLGSLIRS